MKCLVPDLKNHFGAKRPFKIKGPFSKGKMPLKKPFPQFSNRNIPVVVVGGDDN